MPIRLTIVAQPGSELAQQLNDLNRYGSPLIAPVGTVTCEADLPGGLGGTQSGGSVTIFPARDANTRDYDLRVQVLDEGDTVLAETLVRMQPPTRGFSGCGVRLVGVERNGAFELEIRGDLDAGMWHVSASMSPTRIAGVAPSLLLAGLKLLFNVRPPNQLRFAAPFGPVTHPAIRIPEVLAASDEAEAVCDIVESLDVIQRHTPMQILVPDLTSVTTWAVTQWSEAASLLRGEVLTVSWQSLKVHLHPGVLPDYQQSTSVLLRERLLVTVEDEQIDLGIRQVHLPGAQLDPASQERHEDHIDVRIVPSGSDLATVRYVPQEAPVATSPQ